ncbi:MAG: type II secretion system protein GspI [Gammaproteobacteria bacterium 28-57-27]|nr:MAG: type II secretion system protein GspI [Gammaproteobacteria bacterium 28-57-27]
MMRRAAGFTLMEVLVALVILALALGALIKTAGDHALLVADLETRTQAFVVAENQLHRLQATKQWPDASEQKDVLEQDGRRWQWQARFESTPDPDLKRVVLDVRLVDVPGDSGAVQARVIGFLARTS